RPRQDHEGSRGEAAVRVQRSPTRRRDNMNIVRCVIGVVLATLAAHASAQGYPNKPVHMVISFTPGSSTDIVARVVGQKLSEMWGQPVLAENRAGAGG